MYRHNIFDDIMRHPAAVIARFPIFRHPHLVLRIELIFWILDWNEDDNDNGFSSARSVNVQISDPSQIAIMMDTLETAMVRQSQHRDNEPINLPEGHPSFMRYIDVSYMIDFSADTRRLGMTSNAIHLVVDESTQPVLDLLREWGFEEIEMEATP